MDWIDEKLEKIKVKIKHLSLRKAMSFYIILFVIIVVTLTLITLKICDQWDQLIWQKYGAQELYTSLSEITYHYNDYSKLSDMDRLFVEIIDFTQTWSVFIYSIGGIFGATYLFYRNKLKEPLRILEQGAKKIGDSDLDFKIHYDCMDEMGKLCTSFEVMRQQLVSNNKEMWEVMEEQKRLNAAFGHDLRTPLTVLRGYTDFLNRYIPEGKITDEKLLNTLGLMSANINRLEQYSNTMKNIGSLQEICLKPTVINYETLCQKIQDMLQGLKQTTDITIRFKEEYSENPEFMYSENLEVKYSENSNLMYFKTKLLKVDVPIILEVVENLLSNGIRYAKSYIEISLFLDEDINQININVMDDGKGFSMKDLSMATKAYYKDGSDSGSHHFGIGLYICKQLCENHGGSLVLSNRIHGGAIVTASFRSQE
jgi:signal transduction histidine kinase